MVKIEAKLQGVSEIDKAWTWRAKEVNLWTGYQNEGKSLF
jgi:hypothetical protein